MSGYFQTQYQDVVVSPFRNIAYSLQRGELRVPDFQRPHVWDVGRKLALLDSLRRKIPIGAVTVWRTHHNRDASPDFATPIPTPEGDATTWGCYNYILDGHQRLSTYMEAVTDERFKYNPWEDSFHFVEGEAHRDWVPVPVLVDNMRMFEWLRVWAGDFQVTDIPEVLILAPNKAGWGLKDALVPLYNIITDDVEDAAEAFLRLNRGGVWIDDATLDNMVSLIRGVPQQGNLP